MRQWPCSQCKLGELCADCFAIREAEERQRRELEAIYAGELSRSLGLALAICPTCGEWLHASEAYVCARCDDCGGEEEE